MKTLPDCFLWWRGNPNVKEVGLREVGYSDRGELLFSKGYYDCNAVALFGMGFAALSHFDVLSDCSTPSEYLFLMLKSFECRNISVELAVLIGGDAIHLESNRRSLARIEIARLTSYSDNLNEGDLPRSEENYRKDILVLPQQKKVLLHTPRFGYIALPV